MSQIAVVTGGSAGVGRATVRELAGCGYDVAVLTRGRAGVEAAVAEVRSAGQRGLAVLVDVADHDAVEAAAARVEDELAPIDVWVNNAMTPVFGRVSDVSAEEFERATHVTYLGQVWGTVAPALASVDRSSWPGSPRRRRRVWSLPQTASRATIDLTRGRRCPIGTRSSCRRRRGIEVL